MAHFVPTLSGDGYLNLDNIDGIEILTGYKGQGVTPGNYIIVAERHGRTNTILGQRASRESALAFVRELLGDAIHEG